MEGSSNFMDRYYFDYDREDHLSDVDVGTDDGCPVSVEDLLNMADEVFLPNDWQPSDADDEWTILPPEMPVRPAAIDDEGSWIDPLDSSEMSVPTTYCTSSAEYTPYTPERASSSRIHQTAATNGTLSI